MKRITIVILYMLAVSCSGQEKETKKTTDNQQKNTPKDTVMEKFNIEEFEKNKSLDGYYTFNRDGAIVTQSKWGNQYSEKIKYNNDCFILYKSFYKDGNLAQKGLFFQGNGLFYKGIWAEYDEQGRIIQQTNYDTPYKNFPWEKVKAYMESKNINLLDPYTSVYRENENNHPMWYISWDTKEFDKYSNQIIMNEEIDGNTGKVLVIYESYFGEPIPGVPGKKIIYDAQEEEQKQSAIYKTYNGKKYTKEEWVKKEQKMWESYARKHNIPIAKNEDKDKGKFPPSRFLFDE